MNMVCIACSVFRTDLEELKESGQLPNNLQIDYLPGGLHMDPAVLREELQKRIEEVSGKFQNPLTDRNAAQAHNRIVILYGLCGRGVVGLRSGSSTLVLPKVHDCISLFLGGTEAYRRQFSHAPGTYYISAGWYDEQVQPKGNLSHMSTTQDSSVRYPEHYVDTSDPLELEKRYGKDNAQDIANFFNSWKKNYSRAVFIDTGAGDKKKYAAHAREMATHHDWDYQQLEGSRELILRCFDNLGSTEDILVVSPGSETYFDSASGSIAAAPVGREHSYDKNRRLTIDVDSAEKIVPAHLYTFGLGIDAGGTYTDAVLFDFKENDVRAKSKAPTTKWKYSEGIMNAIKAIPEVFSQNPKKNITIDVVSISTTLVTNAIVEGNHQSVGLFLMPLGRVIPDTLQHQPMKIVKGQVAISGDITEEIDPDEITEAAREMIRNNKVAAFAVSGYGGSVNPALELQVKEILRRETGLEVCCGHELSGNLNFSVRARTAVLNAGVMPIMEEFITEVEVALREIGIQAPVLVVRGDGSVMSSRYAKEFPVQTALSGPAASLTGARFLTSNKNATVADVGGTTTDVGCLLEEHISICSDGARIGNWKTHVSAVDMATAGLGGDSEFLFHQQQWSVGPRRVVPICTLGNNETERASILEAVSLSAKRIDDWRGSSEVLQFLSLTGKQPDFPLTNIEKKIFKALENGPMMLWQISDAVHAGSWRLLRTERMEAAYCIQRSGFTPTDLFHAEGLIVLGNRECSIAKLGLISDVADLSEEEMMLRMRQLIVEKMGNVLVEKLLPEAAKVGTKCGSAAHILDHGNDLLELKPRLVHPVIGLGAAAALMMQEAVENLGGQLVCPNNGDVANAIGAVTSKVSVVRKARVAATSSGEYRIHGLESDELQYDSLEEAEERCIAALTESARFHGRKAGTSETAVEISIKSNLAKTAGGEELFLERVYTAELSGVPDIA